MDMVVGAKAYGRDFICDLYKRVASRLRAMFGLCKRSGGWELVGRYKVSHILTVFPPTSSTISNCSSATTNLAAFSLPSVYARTTTPQLGVLSIVSRCVSSVLPHYLSPLISFLSLRSCPSPSPPLPRRPFICRLNQSSASPPSFNSSRITTDCVTGRLTSRNKTVVQDGGPSTGLSMRPRSTAYPRQGSPPRHNSETWHRADQARHCLPSPKYGGVLVARGIAGIYG
ncbi:hypothetical protein C8J57DRAFT_1723270 [Mycena rebaudengoi]|nr:hypothetical protein C8J57DRAFT_1723270 [Mycena rebaudengoi]